MSEPDSILPEIVIDDTAEDYVETDDEPSTPPAKSKPPATEIFEQENEPAPVPVVEPVIPKKPKRQVTVLRNKSRIIRRGFDTNEFTCIFVSHHTI